MKKHMMLLAVVASLALPAVAKIPVTVELPKEAKRGTTITVSVKTQPEAKCKIEAQDAGFTQGLKLVDQTADKSGAASWKFDIPKDYKADEMPVIVTVQKDKEEEKVTKAITVQK